MKRNRTIVSHVHAFRAYVYVYVYEYETGEAKKKKKKKVEVDGKARHGGARVEGERGNERGGRKKEYDGVRTEARSDFHSYSR